MTAFDVTEHLRQGVDRLRLSVALAKVQDHGRLSQRLDGDPTNRRLQQAVRCAWAELADLGPEVRLIEQAAYAIDVPVTDVSLAQVHHFLGWKTAPERDDPTAAAR